MKYIKGSFIYVLVAAILITFLSYAYQTGSKQTTYDFSNRTEQASLKKLASETLKQTKEKRQDTGQSKQQLEQKQDQKQDSKQDQKQEQQENEEQSNDVTSNPEIIQLAENKTTKAPGSIEKSTENKEANHIELSDDAEQENRYFTTNLVDGQTVTEPLFYVTLTHLDETLKVDEQQVFLNGERLKNYNGELQFKEGKNVVKFEITYLKQDGQLITAQQQYAITLNTKDTVIFTNLENKTVQEQKLTFTASAKYKNEDVAVTVLLNDQKLASLGGVAYSTKLNEGKNEIKIEATLNNQTVSKQYEIIYEDQKALIEFETDLLEHRAAEATYSFYARANAGEEKVPLNVTFNEKIVTGNEIGQYTVTLKHGVNTIQVSGNYKSEKISKQYRIIYRDPNVVEEQKVDEKAPKLVTDLKNGVKVKGDIKTINVWPTTASGERIRGKNVLVKVNGTAVPFTWDDSAKTSYKLVLKSGENNVSIKVWDNDGRTITENFIIHSQQVEDNGVIGQVTISVEASTLGIQYLIPPTKMDIHRGEKGSFILDQLLRNNGFTYSQTGTLEHNFYLKDISKPGLLRNLRIPDDLWALVEKYSTRSDRNDYSMDSLGEFDFANGSGWMYSINGNYPNYGLSDAYFLDEDVVRIRYTLHYGKDINGFEGLGGGNDPEWTKQW